MPNTDITYEQITKNIGIINGILANYKDIDALRAAFTDVALEEALDIRGKKKGFELNPILALEADLYINPNTEM